MTSATVSALRIPDLRILDHSNLPNTKPGARTAKKGDTTMVEEIRRLQYQRPFCSFRLRTRDGSSYEVRHPEMIWISDRRVYVGLATDPRVPERSSWLHVPNIVRVEQMEQTSV